MKAKLVDSVRPGDWIYEIKFDGYRALALRGGSETRVLSRNEKDLGGKFPEVKAAIAGLNVQDAIIDGEIVALDDKGRSSFQLLQGFDMGMVRPPIAFYAFDLLQLNGKDLRDLPVKMRAFPVTKPNGPLEVIERSIPEPASRQVRIKMQACGMCHGDCFVKQGVW